MIISFDTSKGLIRKFIDPNADPCYQILQTLFVERNQPLSEFYLWLISNTSFRFSPEPDVNDPQFNQLDICSAEVDDKEFTFLTLKYVRNEHE